MGDGDAPALSGGEGREELLGRASPRWVQTPSGNVRCVVWEGGPRGTAVVCHGLSEQVEKYYDVVERLLGRGFAVVNFDWLGHGRSAPLRGDGKDAFVRQDEALAAVMEQVVLKETQGPRVVVGHSMGGCLACCALHDHPDWFDAGILCSPMLGIKVLKKLGFLASVGKVLSALPAKVQEKVNSMKSHDERFTSDVARFNRHHALLAQHKDLLPDYDFVAWFNGAVKRMKGMQAKGWFESISAPVLFALAGDENLVDNDVAVSSASRMGSVELSVIGGAWHEVLMEREELQVTLWEAIDGFLDAHVPAGADGVSSEQAESASGREPETPEQGERVDEPGGTPAPSEAPKQAPAPSIGKLVMPSKKD